MDVINAKSKLVDGQRMHPTMYGDDGWYAYEPGPYNKNALELYFLTLRPEDRERVGDNAWLSYLEGANPDYPENALREDFERIRQRGEVMRNDATTPDTRLADDPMDKNPASVSSLIPLMLGGLHPGHRGSILHCTLRYFDPVARRAGIPDDVAALVEKLAPEETVVTLVNTNQLEERTVCIQAGGYAEHQFTAATVDNRTAELDASHVTVTLAPGAGARLTLAMRRYDNQPTMRFPWD